MTDASHPAPDHFSFINQWQANSSEHDEAVMDFWRSENAIGEPTHAQARLREVVLRAVDAHGKVAAVCTAVAATVPRIGQPMYYYRCFVGRSWRTTRLVKLMLNRTQEVLEEYARANNYPCIGMLLELENARFSKALRRPVWPRSGFVYIGKSQRNLDLRVSYFRGAQLKK